MSGDAAIRLAQFDGKPRSKLAGLAHARDGTEVPVLPRSRSVTVMRRLIRPCGAVIC